MSVEQFHLFSLGSNDPLADKIAAHMRVPLGKIRRGNFSDGEQQVYIGENLRGGHAIFVQSTNQPDHNFMRLCLFIDAARRASAREITAVIPYFGYARQDRKPGPRTPISSHFIAESIARAGATRVMTMDLHANAIEGFFGDSIVDHLFARPVYVKFFKQFFAHAIEAGKFVVVSPDAGGLNRVNSYAKRIVDRRVKVAAIYKERERPNEIAEMHLIGDVAGKKALIIDDLADTCGTLSKAAMMLKEHGAEEVYAAVTHAVCSGKAYENIDRSVLKKVFVTDTIDRPHPSPKVQVVSVGELFGEAIRRMVHNESLSELFEV